MSGRAAFVLLRAAAVDYRKRQALLPPDIEVPAPV